MRNEDMHSTMTEATRLTAAGRVTEATALIQRTLGGLRIPDAAPPGSPSAERGPQPSLQAGTATARPEPDTGRPGEQEAGEPSVRKLLRRAAAGGLRTGLLQRCRTGSTPLQADLESAAAEVGGMFVTASYSNASGTRAYKLYIPSGYTGQAVPLVIMLHGGTQTAVDFAVGTRLNEFAERNTFLVAYPEQPASANAARCWNWFEASNQDRHGGEPSLIAGITRKIMSDFQIDRRRVYVAGFSAGGAMATIMAATYPDLYAAVGVHSGLAYGAAHDLPSAFAAMKQGPHHGGRPTADAIPLIVFHGDSDDTVDRVNAERIRDDWRRAASKEQTMIRRPRGEPVIEHGRAAGGHEYTRFSFQDALGRPSLELWVVHEAGHAWSGGSPAGSYTAPHGPDASAEMVRFFTSHPKDIPNDA